MSVFIDSAVISDITSALSLGFIKGVTTNPLLMAKTSGSWRSTLREICEICPGPVYYQIDETDPSHFLHTAHEIFCICPEKLVIKIPAAAEYFKLAAELGGEIPFCVTAVYSKAQLVASAESGARHIAVYVNRISNFFSKGTGEVSSDGICTIESMRTLIDKQNYGIRILAASLKTTEEIADALKAGAHDVTTTLEVLQKMTSHVLSVAAIKDFEKAIDEHHR